MTRPAVSDLTIVVDDSSSCNLEMSTWFGHHFDGDRLQVLIFFRILQDVQKDIRALHLSPSPGDGPPLAPPPPPPTAHQLAGGNNR